jgi:hypothetical protein
MFEPGRWSELLVSVSESLIQRPETGMSSFAVAHLDTKPQCRLLSPALHLRPIFDFLYTTCVFSVISLLMTWYLVIPNTSGVPNTTSIWRHHACFFSFQIWLLILPDGVFPIPL